MLTSSVDEAGSQMIRVNIYVDWDWCIPFKVKVTLILCVFNGLDVGSGGQ